MCVFVVSQGQSPAGRDIVAEVEKYARKPLKHACGVSAVHGTLRYLMCVFAWVRLVEFVKWFHA